MENKKKNRRAIRTQFTKVANSIELQDAPTHEGEAKYKLLQDIVYKLEGLDHEIEILIMEEGDETEIEKELEEVTSYKLRWLTLQEKYNAAKAESECKLKVRNEERNYKLPRLELIKFDGNVKNWLPFWGQFEKIHTDPLMHDTDKLQYLKQSMTPGTEVCRFIESYPATNKSYKQAVVDLKERFGRKDLLIQVYVRELLTLILNRESSSLASLYDNMSAQLRALETLGVRDGYSSFILPMVESALPLEILKAWERARPADMKDELESLLEFLKKEVESEQRIQMANTFIQGQSETTSKESTASALVAKVYNNENKANCLWCDKSHSSVECYKLAKMTLDQRRDHIKKKKACMICLKIGHHAKVCKAFVQCFICRRRHSVTLCPVQVKPNDKKDLVPSQTINNNFSSQGQNITLLQTTTVWLVAGEKEMAVRALIDNGSQRSYLKKDVAEKLGLKKTGKETLTHSLFSGVQVKSKVHNIYNISVQSYDRSFKMDIDALDQRIICNNLPRNSCHNDVDISRLLSKHNIKLTDKDECTDISLLIGADYAGYIMTNAMVMLKDGLVAIKTKLGWVLQGKINNKKSNFTNTLFCSSDVSDFCSLELLGIRDPVENERKLQAEAEAVIIFEEGIAITEEEFITERKGNKGNLNTYLNEDNLFDAADADTLNTRLKYMLKLRNFKHRFKNKYLKALVQRGKGKKSKFNIGDIVSIETEEKRVNRTRDSGREENIKMPSRCIWWSSNS